MIHVHYMRVVTYTFSCLKFLVIDIVSDQPCCYILLAIISCTFSSLFPINVLRLRIPLWYFALFLDRYHWTYWRTAKLCRTFLCTTTLYQWKSFNRYGLVLVLFHETNGVVQVLIQSNYADNLDGWVSRVWSKEEEEIWQTNRFKCYHQFQRSWRGCRFKIVLLVQAIYKGIFQLCGLLM